MDTLIVPGLLIKFWIRKHTFLKKLGKKKFSFSASCLISYNQQHCDILAVVAIAVSGFIKLKIRYSTQGISLHFSRQD